MSKSKVCNTCGKRKSLSNYNVNTCAIDGLRTYCRTCATLKMRNYRKTGNTTNNEFKSKGKKGLDTVFAQLKDAYKKYGYDLSKRLRK